MSPASSLDVFLSLLSDLFHICLSHFIVRQVASPQGRTFGEMCVPFIIFCSPSLFISLPSLFFSHSSNRVSCIRWKRTLFSPVHHTDSHFLPSASPSSLFFHSYRLVSRLIAHFLSSLTCGLFFAPLLPLLADWICLIFLISLHPYYPERLLAGILGVVRRLTATWAVPRKKDLQRFDTKMNASKITDMRGIALVQFLFSIKASVHLSITSTCLSIATHLYLYPSTSLNRVIFIF